MMVVVPTFAKRQEGNPPTVGGTIAGSVASIAIFVSGAVDQPGRVEDSGDSNESSPEEPGPSPDQIEQHIGDDGEEKEMRERRTPSPIFFKYAEIPGLGDELGVIGCSIQDLKDV